MLEKFVIEPIVMNAEKFSRDVFNILAPFSRNLLTGLLLLWITWVAYNVVVVGKFDWQQIVKKLLIFVVIGSMLTVNNKIFYEYIYEPIKHGTGDLVNTILSISPQAGNRQFKNSKQAIDQIDASFSDLVELVALISKRTSFLTSPFTSIVTFVIWGIFISSEAIFTFYLVGNNLKLAAISALSPLLILAFAFEQTRSYAISGLKYVLASALTLLIASFCMALILLALRKFVLDLNVDNLPAEQVLSTLGALLILALSAIYFLKLAPEISSVIIGVGTSSVMANIVGGALLGSAGIFKWDEKKAKAKEGFTKFIKETIRSKFSKNYNPTKE